MLTWLLRSLIKRHYLSCSNMCYQNFRWFCVKDLQPTEVTTNSRTGWRIVFYGTDEISVATLRALNLNRLSSGVERVVKTLDVVCIKPGCPVGKYSEISNLKVNYWPYAVPEGKYDVGIVVSFGRLIPTKSILACKYGMINAHPSLLPRWRGAAPIIHSILHGDNETGVTVVQVTPKKFDVGNILAQEKYSIPPNFTSVKLSNDLAQLAAKMIMKTIKDLPNALQASWRQPTNNVTLAPKIQPDMGNIDWEKHSAYDIDKRFRAFFGFIKLYTYFKKTKILLLNSSNPEEATEAKVEQLVTENVGPGYLYFHKKRKKLFVKCMDGWIGITELSIPVRGKITAADFYNGFMTKVEKESCYFTTQPCD